MGENSDKDLNRIIDGLTDSMIDVLATGYAGHLTREGSRAVSGDRRTAKALRTRGLIGDDGRWTVLGREVATVALASSYHRLTVKSLDELHAEALALNPPTVTPPAAVPADLTVGQRVLISGEPETVWLIKGLKVAPRATVTIEYQGVRRDVSPSRLVPAAPAPVDVDPRVIHRAQYDALKAFVAELGGWVKAGKEHHKAMEHRGEPVGQPCWEEFHVTDIHEMLRSVARGLGVRSPVK